MKIKQYILSCMTLIGASVYSQGDSLQRFICSNAHGLQTETQQQFEVEGYAVRVQPEQHLYNEHGLFQLRSKYLVDKNSPSEHDASVNAKHTAYVVKTEYSKDIPQHNIFYFIDRSPGSMLTIEFVKIGTRDPLLERSFVNAVLAKDPLLNVQVVTPVDRYADSINFAGRVITLGRGCEWQGPHNVSCGQLGQINWSEHRTLKTAKEMLERQYSITAEKKAIKLLEESQVVVTFEGTDVLATKRIYKARVPDLLMGGSNVLVAYYVAAPVRGKFVSCVLSHYDDKAEPGTLPQLLSEVMKLKPLQQSGQ